MRVLGSGLQGVKLIKTPSAYVQTSAIIAEQELQYRLAVCKDNGAGAYLRCRPDFGRTMIWTSELHRAQRPLCLKPPQRGLQSGVVLRYLQALLVARALGFVFVVSRDRRALMCVCALL